MHVTAANAHLDCIAFLDLEVDAPLPKLINALRLPQEEDLHLVLFRVLLDVVGKLLVNGVILSTNIPS